MFELMKEKMGSTGTGVYFMFDKPLQVFDGVDMHFYLLSKWMTTMFLC